MGSAAATAVERTGFDALILLLRFHEIAVDPEQVRHQYGGGPFGIPEIRRCAKQFRLKARTDDHVGAAGGGQPVGEPQAAQNGPDKANSTSARTSEPPGQELVYSGARLARTHAHADRRPHGGRGGRHGGDGVEIKTGQRRIIEYLLSPLLRYKQESLRER